MYALFVLLALMGPAAALTGTEIIIANETGTDIVDVYAKCSESSSWGRSILNGTIMAGKSLVVDTAEGVDFRRCGGGRIDIRAQFRTGAVRERSRISITTLRRWTVTP